MSAQLYSPAVPGEGKSIPLYGFAPFGLALFGAGVRSRLSRAGLTLLLLALLTFVAFQSGCSGVGNSHSQSNGTPPGTYSIVVTGTAGAVQHNATATLTVQ